MAGSRFATIRFPIIALGLSSLFESYHWSAAKLAGVGLIVLRNLVVLRRKTLSGRLGENLKAAQRGACGDAEVVAMSRQPTFAAT